MKIRNRSGALFTSTSCIAINTVHGKGEEEFLLPLVAAVMDVQRAEEKHHEVEGEGDHGTHATALGIHTRPAHNWRSVLQHQRGGEGSTKSQVLEDGVEGKKADRWKGNMRNQLDNIDIGLFTNKGTQEALPKENPSSSAEKDMMGGSDEEWKLPKSGGLEMGTLWRQQKNLSVNGIKRKRSKTVIGHINDWKHETNTTRTIRQRQETGIQQEDGRKVGEKSMPIKRYNNNEAEGSQCRRRNGRGWRCSQRTLVGYSLCEYHLGKGRLRSINGSRGRVIVNNKAGTCKFKELRLIDASGSNNVPT